MDTGIRAQLLILDTLLRSRRIRVIRGTRRVAQTEYRWQIVQMFGEVVSSQWESLRAGLAVGGEGLWKKVRRLVADSEGDEEIRWHRRARAEEGSRRIDSLVEQEKDRRVAIWLRVHLGGETPADAPYRPEYVLAMVYRHLGIDPQLTIPDLAGRPRYLWERRELIYELI